MYQRIEVKVMRMRANRSSRMLALLACAAAVGFFHCSLSELAGGGGSDVGNGRVIGKIVTSSGAPAAHTEVMLMAHDYNPVERGAVSGFLLDTTNGEGEYSFSVAQKG